MKPRSSIVVPFVRRALLLLLSMALIVGCSSGNRASRKASYETPIPRQQRNTAKADQLNRRAIKHIQEGEYNEAEKLLKQALTLDITFGPAHNQLGMVCYYKDDLYRAAWEFQYAIRLMPQSAEPRNNLGLVFEKIGRYDEAVDFYSQALQIQPENPQMIGNLARTRLSRGNRDAETKQLLSDLILRETRPQWRDWAQRKLLSLDAQVPEPALPEDAPATTSPPTPQEATN